MIVDAGPIIRQARPSDLDALYAICLATGANGEDAAPLYSDPRLIGHLYVGPYAAFEPESAYVVEDNEAVAGYVVGTTHTPRFEERLDREWWPKLRRQYSDPAQFDQAAWSPDQWLAAEIHHPSRTPRAMTDRYPAHMHLDLLPRMRGRGIAAALLETCFESMRRSGVKAVQIGASRANPRAVRFWQRSGFAQIDLPDMEPTQTIWMGRNI
jgi:GNAT superfamily N-acetyltransferase